MNKDEEKEYEEIKFLENRKFKVNGEWKQFLSHPKIIEELNNIYDEIYEDGKSEIYPEEGKVLRFLEVPISQLKCIIVGLDPYTTNEATGRSFEVGRL